MSSGTTARGTIRVTIVNCGWLFLTVLLPVGRPGGKLIQSSEGDLTAGLADKYGHQVPV